MNFVDLIRKTSAEYNQQLKVDETWVSCSLYVYGKEFYWRGRTLPAAIKKASRILDDTNDILPSVDNRVATLHTGGHAAASKGFSWIIPFLHTMIEVYRCIYQSLLDDPVTRLTLKRTLVIHNMDQVVRILCLFPSCSGGFPTLPWTEYTFRGHPDPVTSALSSLQILDIPTANQILNYIQAQYSDYDVSLVTATSLIDDPSCIPSLTANKGSSVLKHIIKDLISIHGKNKDISWIFSRIGIDEEEEEYREWLLTLSPAVPRVWNSIFKATPYGTRNNIIATIGSLRTVGKFCNREEKAELESRILRSEID